MLLASSRCWETALPLDIGKECDKVSNLNGIDFVCRVLAARDGWPQRRPQLRQPVRTGDSLPCCLLDVRSRAGLCWVGRTEAWWYLMPSLCPQLRMEFTRPGVGVDPRVAEPTGCTVYLVLLQGLYDALVTHGRRELGKGRASFNQWGGGAAEVGVLPLSPSH